MHAGAAEAKEDSEGCGRPSRILRVAVGADGVLRLLQQLAQVRRRARVLGETTFVFLLLVALFGIGKRISLIEDREDARRLLIRS